MKAKYAIRVYRDEGKQFRWRALSRVNGNNVGNGSEGYLRLGPVMDMVYALFGLELSEGSVQLQFAGDDLALLGGQWLKKHWDGMTFLTVEEA